MKIDPHIEISFEACDRVRVLCQNECSLGQLYDFACQFKSFIQYKMEEADMKEKASQASKEV